MSTSSLSLAASAMPPAMHVNGVQVSPLLTTEQAANYLGWGVSTLEQSRVSGINCPAYVKMGRSVRYRLADLDAFVASRIRTSTSTAQAA